MGGGDGSGSGSGNGTMASGSEPSRGGGYNPWAGSLSAAGSAGPGAFMHSNARGKVFVGPIFGSSNAEAEPGAGAGAAEAAGTGGSLMMAQPVTQRRTSGPTVNITGFPL